MNEPETKLTAEESDVEYPAGAGLVPPPPPDLLDMRDWKSSCSLAVTFAAFLSLPVCAALPGTSHKRGHQPWVISYSIPF